MTHGVVMITGAASGIGAATARRLTADGARGLILIDRDEAGLAAVAPELETEVLTLSMDVADEAAWAGVEEAADARFGGVDRVVANAGVAGGGPVADTSLAEWRRVMAVNLDGCFLTLRSGFRLVARGGNGGAMVVVASAAGIKAEPGIGAYAASKAAVIQLARVAAKEGAAQKVRVNAIAPGGVETPIWTQAPFFRDLAEKAGSERAAFDQMAAMATPLGRFATPEEIAGQIAFLLSDAASTITGSVLVADGGYTL